MSHLEILIPKSNEILLFWCSLVWRRTLRWVMSCGWSAQVFQLKGFQYCLWWKKSNLRHYYTKVKHKTAGCKKMSTKKLTGNHKTPRCLNFVSKSLHFSEHTQIVAMSWIVRIKKAEGLLKSGSLPEQGLWSVLVLWLSRIASVLVRVERQCKSFFHGSWLFPYYGNNCGFGDVFLLW